VAGEGGIAEGVGIASKENNLIPTRDSGERGHAQETHAGKEEAEGA